MADRRKNMCCHLVPVYYGERGTATGGQPGTSKNYYYICYVSANKLMDDYRREDTIEALCNGCNKYCYFAPFTKDEIEEKFYKR